MLAMQGASAAKGVKTLRNTPLPWEEEEDSAKIRNPSVGPRLSFRIRSKGEREDASVQQLRTTLTNSLVNMGLLSAFTNTRTVTGYNFTLCCTFVGLNALYEV